MRPKPPVSPMMPGRSRSRRGCSEHMPTVLLMGYSTRMIWRTPSATSRMPSKQVARPLLRCGSKLADQQKVDCCLPRLLRWSVPRASHARRRLRWLWRCLLLGAGWEPPSGPSRTALSRLSGEWRPLPRSSIRWGCSQPPPEMPRFLRSGSAPFRALPRSNAPGTNPPRC